MEDLQHDVALRLLRLEPQDFAPSLASLKARSSYSYGACLSLPTVGIWLEQC